MREALKPARVFYSRRALEVAPALLGLYLVRNDDGVIRVGRIVETEAYMGPEDLAAHSVGGRRTARTEVTAPREVPHAVLVRALEPVARLEQPTWGPGLLCRALNIDRTLSGADLRGELLWIERPTRRPRVRVGRSARIGVEYAAHGARRPWRFFDQDSPYLSTVSAAARRRAATPTWTTSR